MARPAGWPARPAWPGPPGRPVPTIQLKKKEMPPASARPILDVGHFILIYNLPFKKNKMKNEIDPPARPDRNLGVTPTRFSLADTLTD